MSGKSAMTPIELGRSDCSVLSGTTADSCNAPAFVRLFRRSESKRSQVAQEKQSRDPKFGLFPPLDKYLLRPDKRQPAKAAAVQEVTHVIG